MDITESLAPTSDQLDAIELLAGPRTFQIESVSAGSDEQPVQVKLEGFPRVWRPSKGMRRVLAAGWGVNASAWTGRRVTLYFDPAVTFGKDRTGGTRISHMSDLPNGRPLNVPLLITRGKSAMFTVQPLVDAVAAPAPKPANPDAITADKVTELGTAMTNGLELADRDQKLTWLTQQLERPIKSPTELTKAEGDRLLELIRTWTEPPADEPEPTLPEVTA